MQSLEIYKGYFIDFESPYYQMILNGKTNLQINEPETIFPLFDPKREYRKNNYGYRSEEFSADADVLIAGCSHTYGTGIDQHVRWGDVLAKKLNLIPQTISDPGTSIPWLVEKIMSHISTFGPPRRVICLFPDPFRFPLIIDSKTLRSELVTMSSYCGFERIEDSWRGQTTVHSGQQEFHTKDIKFLKRPFDSNVVISRDMALYQSIRSIRFLERYCNDLDIPLIWGSWDNSFSEIINTISTTEYKFNNFVDISSRGCLTYRKNIDQRKDVLFECKDSNFWNCMSNHQNIECDCYLKCHEDYRELVGSDQFYMASDILNGIDHAHYGAHVHMHFAEAFLSSLLEE
jgi:hypothetical protein